MNKKTKEPKIHYVNNAEFLKALIQWKKDCVDAEDSGEEHPPRIPNYIGECILKIASRLSYRPNFANYPYREEMVSDAVLNCITYIGNFDPAKSTSPFGYLTQICWFSFVRIINKEKKEKYTQYKYAEQQNDKDFHHWFNKVYAGVDIGRRDFFGLTDLDMDRFDIMCTPKKTKGKRTRKSKKPTLDI